MLKLAHKFSDLNFTELMAVYIDGNRENGRELYRFDTETAQLRKAEEDFRCYLMEVFFCQSDSFYCIWEEDGHYKAALRLELYCDGYLLCALETAPEARRNGMATALIQSTQKYLSSRGEGALYSHIAKRNTASLAVHRKCGFQAIKDYAVYSDGSVLHSSLTFQYKYKKSEI